MKYYAVIDTNVIVSALLKEDSIPGKIFNYAVEGKIIAILNKSIIKEYKEVLLRNKFGLTRNFVKNNIGKIKKNAIFVDRKETLEKFVDKNDIVFYEVVMSARDVSDAYLVTGNKKHFPIRSYVVTPREMYEIITNLDNNN